MGGSTPRMLPYLPTSTPFCDPQISTIYVGGISFDTDERALQNYFQKFGNVTEVKV